MATKKAATAKRPAPPRDDSSTQESAAERQSRGESPSAPKKRRSPGQIAKLAAEQLLQLTGKEAEGVTALERTDEGWCVDVEVVETRRIPNTTDMLAVYQVEVDSRGNLVGYNRIRRYVRGREDNEAR